MTNPQTPGTSVSELHDAISDLTIALLATAAELTTTSVAHERVRAALGHAFADLERVRASTRALHSRLTTAEPPRARLVAV